GCGAPVTRRFKPGHDARLKGFLLRSVTSRNWWERDAAVRRLDELGWLHFARPEDLARIKVRSRGANGRFTESRHIETVLNATRTWLDEDDVSHAHPACGSQVGKIKPEAKPTGWLCSTCIHTEDWNERAARSRHAAWV